MLVRDGVAADLDGCVALWVDACAVRDGVMVAGVAERARTKFARPVAWPVAEDHAAVVGFALVTEPGTGAASDPDDAAVLGLLAVAPSIQTAGVGRLLLRDATAAAAALGCSSMVLHVLADNVRAIRLYESDGWRATGDAAEHSLLKRPFQTFVRALPGEVPRALR